jgi:hypothetical protein
VVRRRTCTGQRRHGADGKGTRPRPSFSWCGHAPCRIGRAVEMASRRPMASDSAPGASIGNAAAYSSVRRRKLLCRGGAEWVIRTSTGVRRHLQLGATCSRRGRFVRRAAGDTGTRARPSSARCAPLAERPGRSALKGAGQASLGGIPQAGSRQVGSSSGLVREGSNRGRGDRRVLPSSRGLIPARDRGV